MPDELRRQSQSTSVKSLEHRNAEHTCTATQPLPPHLYIDRPCFVSGSFGVSFFLPSGETREGTRVSFRFNLEIQTSISAFQSMIFVSPLSIADLLAFPLPKCWYSTSVYPLRFELCALPHGL